MNAETDSLRERTWWREVFTPRDSLSGEVVKPGGWDHEHCLECWAAISAKSETHYYGWRDEEDRWLCEACYVAHVGPATGKPPPRPRANGKVPRTPPKRWKRGARR
jgi:hypothetical protein